MSSLQMCFVSKDLFLHGETSWKLERRSIKSSLTFIRCTGWKRTFEKKKVPAEREKVTYAGKTAVMNVCFVGSKVKPVAAL